MKDGSIMTTTERTELNALLNEIRDRIIRAHQAADESDKIIERTKELLKKYEREASK